MNISLFTEISSPLKEEKPTGALSQNASQEGSKVLIGKLLEELI